jgi:hypothetical protein
MPLELAADPRRCRSVLQRFAHCQTRFGNKGRVYDAAAAEGLIVTLPLQQHQLRFARLMASRPTPGVSHVYSSS